MASLNARAQSLIDDILTDSDKLHYPKCKWLVKVSIATMISHRKKQITELEKILETIDEA
jgi:vesicle coat complex subunit